MSSDDEHHSAKGSKYLDEAMEVDDTDATNASSNEVQTGDVATAEDAASEVPPSPPTFPSLDSPEEVKSQVAKPTEAGPRPRVFQKPFQPGQFPRPGVVVDTPIYEDQVRVLCWNSVGWVTMKEPKHEAPTLWACFYDTNKYTQFRHRETTADAPFTMAVMGRTAVLFAAGGEGQDSDTPLRVHYRPTLSWGSCPEWTYALPPGEKPQVLALGDTFAACFTNKYIRLWSHKGTELATMRNENKVVAAATYDLPGKPPAEPFSPQDALAYVAQDANTGKYLLTMLNIGKQERLEHNLQVDMDEGAELAWLGWCGAPHAGMLAVQDTLGQVSLLTRTFGSSWMPLLPADPRPLHLIKIRNKFMQGVVEPDPRDPAKAPIITQALTMPAIGRGGLQKKYAEQFQHARMLATSRKAEVQVYTPEVAVLEKQADEAALEMYKDALTGEHESTARALDLANEFNYRDTLETGMRLAHAGHQKLYDKLSQQVLKKNFPGDRLRKCRLPAPNQLTKEQQLVNLVKGYRKKEEEEAKAKASFAQADPHPEPAPKRVRLESEEHLPPPSAEAPPPVEAQQPIRAESPPRPPVPTPTPAKSPPRRGLGNFVAFSPHMNRDPLQTTRCTMEQALDVMHGRVPVAPPPLQPDFSGANDDDKNDKNDKDGKDEAERQAALARRADRKARREAKEARRQARLAQAGAGAQPDAPEEHQEEPATTQQPPVPLGQGWAVPPPEPVTTTAEPSSVPGWAVPPPVQAEGKPEEPAKEEEEPAKEEEPAADMTPARANGPPTSVTPQSTASPAQSTPPCNQASPPASRSSADEGTPGPSAGSKPPARVSDGMAKLMALRRAKAPVRPVQPAFSDGSLAEVKVPEREKAAVDLANVSQNLSAARDAARRAQAATGDSDSEDNMPVSVSIRR
eukprot:Hpha_TRINITY_DN15426_c2_g7::TRINITY_DN15426_c2_g7_i1::g.176555::m.176555/K11274/WDHD1, CTF4; chromosome transmission fidelity protein 4